MLNAEKSELVSSLIVKCVIDWRNQSVLVSIWCGPNISCGGKPPYKQQKQS